MKLLDITRKDMVQSFRSLAALVFMFGVPILVTLLFYFMFGSAGDEEGGFQVARSPVVVVNLDQEPLPAGAPIDLAAFDSGGGGSAPQSMGDLLAQLVASEAFADLMSVRQADDPETARAAVDRQEAAVAIIIPADFTSALVGSAEGSTVELYVDPTLTLGPAIVGSIVRQLVESFAAGSIGVQVAMEQLTGSGAALDPALVQAVVGRSLQAQQAMDRAALVSLQSPSGQGGSSLVTSILGLILGGMTVFFAFFTGAATIQSILVEEETGTLQRLFTTPTPRNTILGGKVLAALLLLLVQMAVLFSFGRLVFRVQWGQPAVLALAGLGIVALAAATGLFLVSFLDNTRQGGIVFGGVLTITGMIGLISVFTAGTATLPPAMQAASLLVPQGWAIRGLESALDGATVIDLLPTLAVQSLWVLVFALVGSYRLRRRFA